VKLALEAAVPPFADRVARALIRPWRWPSVVWNRLPKFKGQMVGEMRRAKGIRD